MVPASRTRPGWVPWTVGAATAALILLLVWLHAFDLFESTMWDLRARTLAAPTAATGLIDVVRVDQASLDWLEENQGQSWPWPREYFGLVADFLARGGAKVTVFDVIFEQPSTLGGDDDAFSSSLRSSGRVVLAEAVEAGEGGLTALPPIPELVAASAALGHVRSTPDADGTNRRLSPWLVLADGTLVPSLAVAALKVGAGLTPAFGTEPALLRFRGPQGTHRAWPAWQILRSEIQLRNGETPQVDPAQFRDHFVFFGYSAPGLLDLRPSPLDPKYPGVEVHATHLDNLLTGDSPRTPAWYWTSLMVVVWALAAALVVGRLRRAWLTAPVFLLAVGLPVAAGWLAYAAGWWWPIVPPVIAALVAGLAMLLVNYAGEGRQKRFIQNAFRQYLSPHVIEQLVQDPSRLQLGGEKRCLSIFFSDVAGFTSISEKLDPVGLTSLLNDYLSEMTTIIYDHGGTIDKYEGDAIIAFWNAPLDLPDHALRAVRASLACQHKLEEIQPRLQKLAGRPVLARIGLNTGDVVIGNMGSAQRFNYTFLGDAGNLASRLEGINKLFGTRFLVSEFTKQSAGDAPDVFWREISRVRVVGKNLPVTVFEPISRASAEARAEVLTGFDRALQRYYAGEFAAALEGFQATADRDPPSAHYAARVKDLLSAPPAVWDGVWEAKEK